MEYPVLTLKEASKHARRGHQWSDTTASIGVMVRRNGAVREYYFNRAGEVVGWTHNGEQIKLASPWRPL